MKLRLDFKFGISFISLYLFWFLSWIVISIFWRGSLSNPYFPTPDIRKELLYPGQDSFIWGTDIYGRSLFEILSAGLTYSICIGVGVTVLAATLGVLIAYGSLSLGKIGGKVLDLFTNLVFIFPTILIAILFMSVVGQSPIGLGFILVFTGWPSYARIARGEIKRVLSLSFIESSRAIGASELRIFFKEVLPAIIPQLIIHMVLGISGVIINESVLGFLGLGGSQYSWGTMLSMAKSVLLEAPHITVVISLVMAGLIIGLNLLGDGLRDYLDPKEKTQV